MHNEQKTLTVKKTSLRLQTVCFSLCVPCVRRPALAQPRPTSHRSALSGKKNQHFHSGCGSSGSQRTESPFRTRLGVGGGRWRFQRVSPPTPRTPPIPCCIHTHHLVHTRYPNTLWASKAKATHTKQQANLRPFRFQLRVSLITRLIPAPGCGTATRKRTPNQ